MKTKKEVFDYTQNLLSNFEKEGFNSEEIMAILEIARNYASLQEQSRHREELQKDMAQ